jgi:hypothetical protein
MTIIPVDPTAARDLLRAVAEAKAKQLATAKKERGAEWYYPAVRSALGGSVRLFMGDRHATRHAARKQARALIAEALMAEEPRA